MEKMVILGAGESGTGAAVLAKIKGLEVFVSDSGEVSDTYKKVLWQHEIDWEEGRHSEEIVLHAGEVVKSPGIPDSAPIVGKLKERGVKVISEIEFAGRYSKAKMIGVTGTNGKTTTKDLLNHVLSASMNVMSIHCV